MGSCLSSSNSSEISHEKNVKEKKRNNSSNSDESYNNEKSLNQDIIYKDENLKPVTKIIDNNIDIKDTTINTDDNCDKNHNHNHNFNHNFNHFFNHHRHSLEIDTSDDNKNPKFGLQAIISDKSFNPNICKTDDDNTKEEIEKTEIEKNETDNNDENEIKEPEKVELPEYKILMLGSGESGKSTIMKQLKIIHQEGYTQEELALYRTSIYKNVLECAKALANAYKAFNIQPNNSEVKSCLDRILKYYLDADPNIPFNNEVAEAIKKMWADKSMEKILDHQSEFYLMDSASYFMNNLDRISKVDYIPNTDDFIRARIRSTGVATSTINLSNMCVHLFDVGGQRSERRKWITCFENVTSIIFCVSLSEYDQVLLEESHQNRMYESMVLFDSIVNSRWFAKTSIILFLNKIDIFREKLKKYPLQNYFPDYTGDNDPGRAAKYILWRFTQLNRSGVSIYPHITCATDTSNIRVVFAAVQETILQNALKDSGIV